MKPLVKPVLPAALFLLSVSLFFGRAPQAYYPGSPDRLLGVMQTANITENKHLHTFFNHRFIAPISSKEEPNPFYEMLGIDGGANTYFDISWGLANLVEVTVSRESEHKTYGLEGKLQFWNQKTDARPLSLAVSANTQVRTVKEFEDDRRYSTGGRAIADWNLLSQRLNLLGNLFAQSHTNPLLDDRPVHSYGAGLGLITRYDRLSFFGEWVFPLSLGGRGYVDEWVENGVPRYEDGIFLQAYGFNYRIYYHAFTLVVSNHSRVSAVNFLPGAQPGAESGTGRRKNEWRLGFNLSRTYKLMH